MTSFHVNFLSLFPGPSDTQMFYSVCIIYPFLHFTPAVISRFVSLLKFYFYKYETAFNFQFIMGGIDKMKSIALIYFQNTLESPDFLLFETISCFFPDITTPLSIKNVFERFLCLI